MATVLRGYAKGKDGNLLLKDRCAFGAELATAVSYKTQLGKICAIEAGEVGRRRLIHLVQNIG